MSKLARQDQEHQEWLDLRKTVWAGSPNDTRTYAEKFEAKRQSAGHNAFAELGLPTPSFEDGMKAYKKVASKYRNAFRELAQQQWQTSAPPSVGYYLVTWGSESPVTWFARWNGSAWTLGEPGSEPIEPSVTAWMLLPSPFEPNIPNKTTVDAINEAHSSNSNETFENLDEMTAFLQDEGFYDE